MNSEANEEPAVKRQRLDDEGIELEQEARASGSGQVALLTSSTADAGEPVSVAYDEEDLEEDVHHWLDRNYTKSKLTPASVGCSVPSASASESDLARLKRSGADDGNLGDDCGHQEDEEFVQYEKTVLVERGKQHFDVLPDGWVMVSHDSGMPVYLHKASRVCSLARPYFLGPGSVRKHDIPLAAIPCLQYRREKEKSDGSGVQNPEGLQEPVLDSSCAVDVTTTTESVAVQSEGLCQPKTSIETAGELSTEMSINSDTLHDYCKHLFEFKTVSIKKFKTWKDRREYTRKHRPQMPPDATLIVCSAADLPLEYTSGVVKKADLVLNPKGKTYICILHEYLQWAMKTKPMYTYSETENSANPYCAVVKIGEMDYGVGYGANKKNAKSDAARKTLAILLPHAIQKIEAQANSWENMKPLQVNQDITFFDCVKVDDSRLNDLCKKAGQPSPYAVLLECLKRNYMMGDTDVKIETNVIATAKVEVTLTVGKHTATVMAKNKKVGKQLASQSLLQKLHPHITCWGSILRLYGSGSIVSVTEKKLEQQSITQLQHKEYNNGPNHHILDKLREHMLTMYQRKEASKNKAKFKFKNAPLSLSL